MRNGRIERIDAQMPAQANERIFDAAGSWQFPGMIDGQIHFLEPGLVHESTSETESRACIAGGIPRIMEMEMPNTGPPAINRDAPEAKHERARLSSRANFDFHPGATNDNPGDTRPLDPRSAPGIEVFMGASTGNMLVDNPPAPDAIFREAPTPIITHCEVTSMIVANGERACARWGDDIPAQQHPLIRSRKACLKPTELAISLARKHGTRLHVLHISTADELALFSPGPIEGKRVTAETCAPAEGRIDVLATGPAPHLAGAKAHARTSPAAGPARVQCALQVALERVFDGETAQQRLLKAVTHAPATLFNVHQRGYLRERCHADLVAVDPNLPHALVQEEILSMCACPPLEGTTFRSSIAATFGNGQLAWNDGRLDDRVRGQRLRIDR